MAPHMVMVGALGSVHLGQDITLTSEGETHTDTLVSVRHDADGTHIETEFHWDGTWAHTDTCTIESKKEARA